MQRISKIKLFLRIQPFSSPNSSGIKLLYHPLTSRHQTASQHKAASRLDALNRSTKLKPRAWMPRKFARLGRNLTQGNVCQSWETVSHLSERKSKRLGNNCLPYLQAKALKKSFVGMFWLCVSLQHFITEAKRLGSMINLVAIWTRQSQPYGGRPPWQGQHPVSPDVKCFLTPTLGVISEHL